MSEEQQPQFEGPSPLMPYVPNGDPSDFYGPYGIPADAYSYSPTVSAYNGGDSQTSQFPFFGFPFGGFGPFPFYRPFFPFYRPFPPFFW
ncbi:hypothetical protein ACFQ4Y_04130 [Kroppenstedtia sanguinis]|uniref:Spore coat protein n=2 Tax=Kroppenstedtia sanguinis TaxID=1380684 RepID=A0ABW4C5Y1_9BACL